jgi:hypothetical protein
MSDETALAKFDMGINLYGDFRDSVALAQRIKKTVPGADKLDDWNLVAYANYCIATGANPHRDMHGWQDKKGNLQMCEDYKLLVRWAKAQEPYNEMYDPMEPERLKDGDIGYVCHIMRASAYQKLDLLCKAGLDPAMALEQVRTTVGGIVRAKEAQHPCNVKGWDWVMVAQKRALKNALNQAYGMPSLAEIARMSWNVDGVETQAEDWEVIQDDATPAERREVAKYKAKLRKATKEARGNGDAVQAIAEVFDDDASAEYQDALSEKPPEPATAETVTESETELPMPHAWTADEARDLTNHWRNELVITDDQALEMLGVAKISEFSGDAETAKKLIVSQIALEAQHAETEGVEG